MPALAAETRPKANAPLRIIVFTMDIFLPGFQIAAPLAQRDWQFMPLGQ
jgi:hypothetical protein